MQWRKLGSGLTGGFTFALTFTVLYYMKHGEFTWAGIIGGAAWHLVTRSFFISK